MLKKIFLTLVLICSASCFAGCRTVQGVGRDIKWAGRAGAEVVDQIIYPPHKNQKPKIAYDNY